MKAVIAIEKKSTHNPTDHPEVVRSAFRTVIQGGTEYVMLHAFEKYIDPGKFEHVFADMEDFETWLAEGVDKEIVTVAYDWKRDKVLITIADKNFPGPHEFDLGTRREWTSGDCESAVNMKFL